MEEIKQSQAKVDCIENEIEEMRRRRDEIKEDLKRLDEIGQRRDLEDKKWREKMDKKNKKLANTLEKIRAKRRKYQEETEYKSVKELEKKRKELKQLKRLEKNAIKREKLEQRQRKKIEKHKLEKLSAKSLKVSEETAGVAECINQAMETTNTTAKEKNDETPKTAQGTVCGGKQTGCRIYEQDNARDQAEPGKGRLHHK
ncbi:unnamed protein product [Pocillopora meandrina]|uniref:Uncharacterized protein n=1 Tax=Pocillopora meandrina TaxID=46732 RepID=A0AAU9VTU1_9CNID|nr:unnamed protein product [Pocillopora meandrina]